MMMINRRRAYGGKSLPYDAEIEYLKTDGNQYINPLLPVTEAGYVVDTELLFTNTIATSIFGYNYNDGLYQRRCSIGYNNSSTIIFGYGDGKGIYGENKTAITTKSLLKIDLRTPSNLYINNLKVLGPLSATRSNPIECYFLAYNNYTGATGKFVGKLYNARIYDANMVLIRNYIPVRVGQVGYLYDKVSGQLFGNAGTGSFILGPDV